MKKFFFSLLLFPLLGAGSLSAAVTVTPLGVDYSTKKVTFTVSWTGAAANNRVWVFVDLCPVAGTASGTFAKAVISGATAAAGGIDPASLNGRGFYVTASPSTVTATLSNATGKFNWCAYGSDYPPNVLANTNSSYTLAGTPPFLLIASNGATSLTVPGTTIATAAVTFTPAIITDATGYPGLWCPYTGTDLYMDATHRCLQRQSGAGNWEAWIKDTRDNHLYRIVQMPTNTWWMAEDLMWDGKPNPTATGYTIRGHARSCGAHYGCGRFYNSTATGAGAYSGNANSRRTNNVCPTQWVIPSSREFCDYATSTQNPQPYLGTAELGGPDSHGLSLWICASESWNCGTVHTAYVAGSGAVHYWYRPAGHVPPAPCNDTYEGGGSRNVRCVRDL